MHALHLASPSPQPHAAAASKPQFSTLELLHLSRALNTLVDVASALSMRPGLSDGGTSTRAGRRFDDLTQRLCDEYLAVMEELRESQPRTERDAEDRGCDLLAYDLACDQDTTDVALAAVRKDFPGRY